MRDLKGCARFIIAVLFVLTACRLAQAQTAVDTESLRLAFYAYDAALPLNPELKELTDKDERLIALRTRYHLAYDSAHDQRVTAIFTIPKRFSAPFPAVILLAGTGGHNDTDYVRFDADMVSKLGDAAVHIDAH